MQTPPVDSPHTQLVPGAAAASGWAQTAPGGQCEHSLVAKEPRQSWVTFKVAAAQSFALEKEKKCIVCTQEWYGPVCTDV